MCGLVGNTEDRFSHNAAHIINKNVILEYNRTVNPIQNFLIQELQHRVVKGMSFFFRIFLPILFYLFI